MEKANNMIYENCKDLVHFTHLAKENWKRAVELFYHDLFEDLLQGEDKNYLEIYRALSICPMNEHHVNEFLELTNQKDKIKYSMEQTKFHFKDMVDESIQLIPIRKEGWGYVNLQIQCEESFLQIHKGKIESSDFIHDEAKIAIEILPERLHAGYNYAKIVVNSLEVRFEIEVLVERQDIKVNSVVTKNIFRKNAMEMISSYVEMRAKKIDQGQWIEKIKRNIPYVNNKSEYWCLIQLFKAHIAITEEKFEETTVLLNGVWDNINPRNHTSYCYYLYLTVLYRRDSVYGLKIYQQVQQIYENNPHNWKIAWICFYMADMTYETPENRWSILKEQFNRKCCSPIMYIEAIELWNQYSELLDELTVENCRILRYGIQNQLLSMELILKVTYLVEKQKIYVKQLIPILEACYEYVAYDEILVAICTHLMMGNNVNYKYFRWYELAVVKNINLAGIYESYMMARDSECDAKIPKSVLLYFSFENHLPIRQCEILYTYIMKNHKDDEGLYLLYRDKIEMFLKEQVDNGRVNKELSYLYDAFFVPEQLTTKLANSLFVLLFSRCIVINLPTAVNVVVVRGKSCTQEYYIVQGNAAIVPLYHMNNVVFIEDEEGNRYGMPIAYEGEKYAWIQQRASQLEPFVEAGYHASMYYCGSDEICITSQSLHHYEYLHDDERIMVSYRNDIELKLIQYYECNDIKEKLYECLSKVDLGQVLSQHIDYILQLHMIYGLEEKVIQFGGNSIEQMWKFWNMADAVKVDHAKLSIQLLKEMVKQDTYVSDDNKILLECIKRQGNSEDIVVYLDKKCYQYMKQNEEIDTIIKAIGDRYTNKLYVSVMCQIAYLHYYSKEKLQLENEDMVDCAKGMLSDLITKKHLFLSFFIKYYPICDLVCGYEGLSFVEYIGAKNSTVILYYRTIHVEDESEYEKEELPEISEGIYAKSFSLSSNQTMEYYIVETTDEDEFMGELNFLSSPTDAIFESKYDRIQRMLEAQAGKNYEELEQLIKKYDQTQHLVDTMFWLES